MGWLSGQLLDNGERRKKQMGRTLLLDVYRALYGPEIAITHLDELARELSQIAGRERPWTGKYLHSLIKGYRGFSVNGKLVEALSILAARLKGTDEVQARAREVDGLLVVHDLPPGTVVLGQARRCAAPGCPVVFVPTHPRQKYHSRECARVARRWRGLR